MAMEDIQARLTALDATKIFFTDLNGRLMSLPVNPDHIPQIVRDGVGFDGSSIAGMARVDNSDRQLFPDPDSLRILEFRDQTLGCFIGRIFNERGLRAAADPRAVLENVVARAESDYGYRFVLGPEHEFFLLTGEEFGEKGHSDQAGYFVATPHDKGEAVRWLISRLDLDPERVRPLYIGDDVTDEDAFRALQGRGRGIVVHGGKARATYAGFRLADPEAVRSFLNKLTAAMEGGA